MTVYRGLSKNDGLSRFIKKIRFIEVHQKITDYRGSNLICENLSQSLKSKIFI